MTTEVLNNSKLSELFDNPDMADNYLTWNPNQGEAIGGTIIKVGTEDRFNGSIYLIIEQTNKQKIKWYLSTVPKNKLADMSMCSYNKDSFNSVTTAIRTLVGKGIAIRFDGHRDSKYNKPYKVYTIVFAPMFDSNIDNLFNNTANKSDDF